MAIVLIGGAATIMFASSAFYAVFPWVIAAAFASMIYGGIIATVGPGEYVEGAE